MTEFARFLRMLPLIARLSVLLWRLCDALCTSGVVDDVTVCTVHTTARLGGAEKASTQSEVTIMEAAGCPWVYSV